MVDIDDYRVEDNRKNVMFHLDLTGFIDDLIRERLEIILEEEARKRDDNRKL